MYEASRFRPKAVKKEDPHVSAILDLLLVDDSSLWKEFETTLRAFIAWETERHHCEEYLSRDEFMIALTELVKRASERVDEQSQETPEREHAEYDALDSWEGA
jgi:hypothetical protein